MYKHVHVVGARAINDCFCVCVCDREWVNMPLHVHVHNACIILPHRTSGDLVHVPCASVSSYTQHLKLIPTRTCTYTCIHSFLILPEAESIDTLQFAAASINPTYYLPWDVATCIYSYWPTAAIVASDTYIRHPYLGYAKNVALSHIGSSIAMLVIVSLLLCFVFQDWGTL